MASLSNQRILRALYEELADIERQQEDKTLPHSDQQLLDQAWEDITNHIDELEDIIASEHKEEEEDQWRDAAEYLDSEEEDNDYYRPPSPVRIAPPPPAPRSVTVPTRLRLDASGARVVEARRADGTWNEVAFPSFAPPPPPLSATRRPPPIEIPKGFVPTVAPPPPRPDGARICNCDSDGQCAYCEEEELERWNNMEDDRPGCEYCSGCAYCMDGPGYNGADEV